MQSCRPPVAAQALALPAHFAWVTSAYPEALTEVVVDAELELPPDPSVGFYLGLFGKTTTDTEFYAGLQTQLHDPNTPAWLGPGFLFSRWSPHTRADARPVADGFVEVGAHEGGFVGVRRARAWGPGLVHFRLRRGEPEAGHDWFIFDAAVGDGAWEEVGALRFARTDPATPIAFHEEVTVFLEVYRGVTDVAEVPRWPVRFRVRGDGAAPTQVRVEYPRFPKVEFPNSDLWWDDGWVKAVTGAMTPRCHGPGEVFRAPSASR